MQKDCADKITIASLILQRMMINTRVWVKGTLVQIRALTFVAL